jgi:hypothetical protein
VKVAQLRWNWLPVLAQQDYLAMQNRQLLRTVGTEHEDALESSSGSFDGAELISSTKRVAAWSAEVLEWQVAVIMDSTAHDSVTAPPLV